MTYWIIDRRPEDGAHVTEHDSLAQALSALNEYGPRSDFDRDYVDIVHGKTVRLDLRDGKLVEHPKHYPPGMGEESRRLHREYNALVRAQEQGAKNGAEVRRLTDECAAKGIILVPGGEFL